MGELGAEAMAAAQDRCYSRDAARGQESKGEGCAAQDRPRSVGGFQVC
jgi:hypothetical protein